jgi:hypothetical protein
MAKMPQLRGAGRRKAKKKIEAVGLRGEEQGTI